MKTRPAENGGRISPFLYLGICFVAFGLFIPFLGFYWDDWPTIFYTHSNRVSQLVNHFSYDRPFSVWAYYLIGRLGTSPIVWHVVALLQRWALVLALAWALKPLWPRQTKQILYIALIFAIYPGHWFQPLSVIFAPHLAAYSLFFISLGSMGRAIAEPNQFRKFTVLALVTCAAQLFTLEYYAGLELVRPLYIWFLLEGKKRSSKQTLLQTLKLWAPYLGIFILWFAWRLFIFNPRVEPYPLAIGGDPLAAIVQLAKFGANDFIFVLVQTWFDTIKHLLPANGLEGLFFAIAMGTAVLLFAYLKKAIPKKRTEDRTFVNHAFLLGLLAFFAGMFPIWAIGEAISKGDYSQRYILVAMFGAALIVVALISWVVQKQKLQVLLFALLVGLAINGHLRRENEFRLDWEAQRSFYWQLFWRAPAIQPSTAMVSFDRLTDWTGEPLLGNALNTIYPPRLAAPYVDLWNFELTRTKTVLATEGRALLTNIYRGLLFSMTNPDGLFIYYKPEEGCLWVLNPLDVHNEYIPTENRHLAAYSNTSVILPESAGFPDPAIFSAEPVHDWCYYYEKASLANQHEAWQETIDLVEAASREGLQPTLGIEWLPLIEAYAMTGKWQPALELSQVVHDMQIKNDSMLCALWAELSEEEGGHVPAAQIGEIANCNG